MKIKTKSVTSFRKALMVPFIICILTFYPSVKNTFEWLELKYLDLLFTLYPEICSITGQKEELNSPTIIIKKDQSFLSREAQNKNPTRKDFANLLENLRKQGVKVAAFDYIYDEKSNEEDDNAFIHQLDLFPYSVLAYNYVGRGQQNFGLVDLMDERADRITGIVNLYRPISEKAIARGLINIPSDLDIVIRYAPLAFHLDESERFLPSLGFSTWVVSLLAEKEEDLNKIDISNSLSLSEAFEKFKKSAPYPVHTIGHKGIDKAIIDLENNFLYKFIIKRYPKLKANNLADLRKIYDKFTSNKTWVKLPEEPLPIIGGYDTPCLRLPFQKQTPPLKGDGIETMSMFHLLPTEREENSTLLFGKNQLTITPDEKFQKIKPAVPSQKSGNNAVYGNIISVSGKPVKNAQIWAIMSKTGYWERTKVDDEGKYRLENLPEGNFNIIVFVESLNGCDKAMLNVEVNQKEKQLPLLMLDDNTNSIEIPSEIIPNNNETEFWVYGHIIPMLYSNQVGNTFAKKIPEGFTLNGLDDSEENEEDEEKNFTMDEEGNLFLNDKIATNTIIAILPTEDEWNTTFFRRITLKKGKDFNINDLPSSLDATINVTSRSSLRTSKNNLDIEIKPKTPKLLTSLPRPYQDFKQNINLRVDFPNSVNQEDKVILVSESGKVFEVNNKETIDIPNDKYIVLTQSNDSKGLYKEAIVNKKTVFLGTALPTDQDFIVSPINFLDYQFTKMAGVHIHANLFAALSQGRHFYAPPFHMDRAPKTWPFLQFLLFFPILIILNIVLKNAKSTKTTLVILIIVGAICLLSVFLFPRLIIIPVFYPSLMIISFGIARSFVEWINSRRLAAETQNAFSHFISADVVNQIINNPNAIRPGGEKKELTIMFTDIAGFTSISEKLDADSLTELMNSYLDEMTKILFKNGGTLDKYIGDAIMGFWNHPTTQEDHTTRAVTCAIEMQKKLKEMRENWMAQGLPKVEMRAGINSGTCMVGFIGSKIQMNFTCLGDNVNLASRLEGANKAYGTFIMISESVKKQLNPYLFSTRFLDFLAVKGKNEPVLVYEVRGWLNEETEIWKEKAGKIYQQGIDKYLAREWDNAIQLFREVLSLVPDDSPSKVYIERCEHFKQEPPDENWDGRFVLKTK